MSIFKKDGKGTHCVNIVSKNATNSKGKGEDPNRIWPECFLSQK